MTRDEATIMLAEINRLYASHTRQLNVEFEGVDPGFLTQIDDAENLEAKINRGGFIIHNGELLDAGQVQDIREKFNRKVREYMAANPGRQVPSAVVNQWVADVGMPLSTIKAAVKTLGL